MRRAREAGPLAVVACLHVHPGGEELDYHAMVIATGARARTLPGTEHLEGVHCLRTLDDAIAIRAALEARACTVVVGTGFIGSEVASGAHKRGLSATLLEVRSLTYSNVWSNAVRAAATAAPAVDSRSWGRFIPG